MKRIYMNEVEVTAVWLSCIKEMSLYMNKLNSYRKELARDVSIV